MGQFWLFLQEAPKDVAFLPTSSEPPVHLSQLYFHSSSHTRSPPAQEPLDTYKVPLFPVLRPCFKPFHLASISSGFDNRQHIRAVVGSVRPSISSSDSFRCFPFPTLIWFVNFNISPLLQGYFSPFCCIWVSIPTCRISGLLIFYAISGSVKAFSNLNISFHFSFRFSSTFRTTYNILYLHAWPAHGFSKYVQTSSEPHSHFIQVMIRSSLSMVCNSH